MRYLALIILLSLIMPVQAKMLSRELTESPIKIAGQSPERVISKKKLNRLLGVWGTSSNQQQLAIRINSFNPSSLKGISVFHYDISIDSILHEEDSIGYIVGRNIFFTISFIEGVSSFAGRLSKNVDSFSYLEVYEEDSSCENTFINDIVTSLPYYACTFPLSNVSQMKGLFFKF